jgi:hypothetical protein
MQTGTVEVRLPAAWLKEIGQIITLYSFYEYGQTIYFVLGLDKKQGRIAVRELRGQDQVEMLGHILKLAGLTLPTDLKTLEHLTRYYNSERDRLAHCVWIRDRHNSKNFCAINTKGSWNPDGTERVPRKIKPEIVPYDLAKLRLLRRHVGWLCKIVARIARDVSRELKKRQKAPTQQSVRKGRPASRSPAKRKLQPRS